MYRLLLALLLAASVTCSVTSAQGFSAGETVSDSVIYPQGVFAADMDHDGDLDVLSASKFGGEIIAWYENLAPGLFGPERVIGTVRSASEVVAADINTDGLLDVVAAGEGENVVVFLRITGGGFGPGVEAQPHTGFELWDLHVVDLDADGHLDLLTATRRGLLWYRGDSTGSFAVQPAITPTYTERIAVGDVNGDGILDLAWSELVPSGDNRANLAIAVSPAQFTTVQTIDSSDTLRAVALGDADGDGDVDLFWGDPSATFAALSWNANNGSGQFGPERQIGGRASEIRLGDVDADGILDVVSGNNVHWNRGLGGGAFGPAQSTVSMGGVIRDICIGDLDGDLDLDIITAVRSAVGAGPDMIIWHENITYTGLGLRYCDPSVPNSTLRRGSIRADGNATVFLNDFQLTAQFLPGNSFGFFLASQAQGFTSNVSNSQGNLCVAGNVGRFVGPGQIMNSGGAESFTLGINLNAMPTPTGLVAAQPGETWNFQAWHRDANPTTTSNFTNAVGVTFL